ncbi:HAMP domain-containing histidine kinase [Vibrio sp. S4M6]|uniref:sensor histidine kinase n=1 Tax=Vibrio sinus TaxID=2946865 RepID=UPI002029B8E5|nr:HAMP domain-containing sensor histidine kinase [Vibrio sinus]MCL9780685.1 HAMP domain-containing histidine kinase [Vibrio sinus]
MTSSIKHKLVLSWAVLLLPAVISIGLILYTTVHAIVRDVDNARLRSLYAALEQVIRINPNSGGDLNGRYSERSLKASKQATYLQLESVSSSKKFSYVIIDYNTHQVWQSQHAPPISKVEKLSTGFANFKTDDNKWHGITMFFRFKGEKKPARFWFGEDKHVRKALRNKMLVSVVIPCFIALILVLLFVCFVTKFITNQLHRLEQDIKETSGENLSSLRAQDHPAELSSLIANINGVFGQVQSLWQKDKAVSQDIVHELKTPISILKIYVQQALSSNGASLNELIKIERVVSRSERMIEQISILHKLSKSAEIKSEQLYQQCDLKTTVVNVIEELLPVALQNEQDVSLDAEGEHYIVMGDEILIFCLFKNLIDNCIRYSGLNSKIKIQLIKEQQGIKAVISDNGKGMSDEDLVCVFDRFYRSKASQMMHSGAGLGMNIAKTITEAHLGEISVQHQQVGTGVKFTVFLPYSQS